MRPFSVIAAAASCLSGLSAATATETLCHPRVNSTSGTIVGHRAPNRTDTYEFLGIKYARAPVGDLRFAAPRRYVPEEAGHLFNASNWVSGSFVAVAMQSADMYPTLPEPVR